MVAKLKLKKQRYGTVQYKIYDTQNLGVTEYSTTVVYQSGVIGAKWVLEEKEDFGWCGVGRSVDWVAEPLVSRLVSQVGIFTRQGTGEGVGCPNFDHLYGP